MLLNEPLLLRIISNFNIIFASLLEEEDSENSSSDVEVKKRGRRHKLLRHKLSLSEGESGEEKAASKEKKKGGKKKSGQKGWFWIFLLACVLCLKIGENILTSEIGKWPLLLCH